MSWAPFSPAFRISLSAAYPGSVGAALIQKLASVAIDDGQEIIEIVSDASGQPPNAFHFLSLPEVALHLFELRDVMRDAPHPL